MFKILKDQKATSKDLAETYVQATALEEALSTEKMEIHQKLMELQVDSFDRKPSRELLSVKTEMDALIIRLEACRFGQEQIKSRLGKVLQKEAALRLERIKEELASLSSEEKEIQEAFLSAAAKAAVLKEQIKGRSLLSDSRGYVTAGVPSLKVELHLLDGSDGAFYSQEVKRFRQESAQDFSQTIRGQRDDLIQERGKLERLLSGDPIKNAEELLNKLIPSKPEPETEPEGRKTTTFIKDYDKIGGVDYGLGQELPFKSVDEILRAREEMT